MARVSGPLMSMEASGTIASTLVYSRWKGIPYVRRHAIPSNPRSPKQIAVRASMRFFSRQWPGLVQPYQALWKTQAESMHQSGFNRYIAVALRDMAHMLPPTATPTPSAPGTPCDAATVVATGGIGNATVVITDGLTPPTWGYAIFAKLGGAPTPGPDTLVGVVDFGNVPFVHTPIAAGTWHYIVRGFDLQVTWGADSTDTTATVS